MPYIGKKPENIIATAVDSTTGDFSGNVTAGGTLGVTGAVTANAGVVVDNITIDGTEIDLSSGDLTIDVANNIILDANNGFIVAKKAGTTFGNIYESSGSLAFLPGSQDADIIFQGNDGGATITALTLDMSDAGAATLNNGLTLTDGNLVVASGHGIDFGATANSGGSMQQELLDDYEEGTWTPAIVGLSNTPTFAAANANYTKIGRVCTIQFFQQTSTAPTFNTGTNEFQIGGLPFAVASHGYVGSQGSVMAQAFFYHGNNNTQSVTGSASTGGCYLTAAVNTSEQLYFHVTNSGGTRGIVNNNGATQGYIIEATVTYFTTD